MCYDSNPYSNIENGFYLSVDHYFYIVMKCKIKIYRNAEDDMNSFTTTTKKKTNKLMHIQNII